MSHCDYAPISVDQGLTFRHVALGQLIIIPVETIKYYKLVMDKVGSRCDLFLYEDQKHGFFNYETSPEFYEKSVYQPDKFLMSLGSLKGEPTIGNKK